MNIKRKKYIVKRDFQIRIFLEILIFMLFTAIIVGWTVYLAFFKTILFELSGEKITLINKVISFKMLIWFLPVAFSILIFSVFLSHQIAGPIFVFQRAVKGLTQGQQVKKITLRRNDKLKDLADDLNNLIEYINDNKSQDSTTIKKSFSIENELPRS